MRKHGFASLNGLLELAMAYRASKPFLVAIHYDFFTRIGSGSRTAAQLARESGLEPRAVGIVLEALSVLGVLEKTEDRYSNTQTGTKFLVAGSPDYIGDNLKYQEHTWDAWSDLRNVLKSGRPNLSLIDWIHRGVFREDYIRAMGDVARWPARDLAGKLDLRRVDTMLDVGCGAGTYSAAIVERRPQIQATLLDLAATLPITRRLLKGHPHESRFRFRAANFLEHSFGRGLYDLVLISNVTHVEDAGNNRKLIEKAYAALRPGGRLVIHDYVARDSRTPPKFAAMLSLHLLLFTGRGNVYTLDEYAGWMRQQRFRRIAHKPVATGSLYSSMAIIGRKS